MLGRTFRLLACSVILASCTYGMATPPPGPPPSPPLDSTRGASFEGNFNDLKHIIDLYEESETKTFVQTSDFLIVQQSKPVSFLYSINAIKDSSSPEITAELDDEFIASLSAGEAFYTAELKCAHCKENGTPLPPQPIAFDFETSSTDEIRFSFTPILSSGDSGIVKSRVAVSISKNGREIDQVPIELCVTDQDISDDSLLPKIRGLCSEAFSQETNASFLPGSITEIAPSMKMSFSRASIRLSRAADFDNENTPQIRLSSANVEGRGAVIWVEIYDAPFRDWLENTPGAWEIFERNVEKDHTKQRVLTLSFDAERDLQELRRYKTEFHMMLSCVMLRSDDMSTSADAESDLWKAARSLFWQMIMSNTGCEDPTDPMDADAVFASMYLAGQILSDDIGKSDWKNFITALGGYQSSLASYTHDQFGDRFLDFYEPMRLESRLGGLPIQFLHPTIFEDDDEIAKPSGFPQFFGFLFEIANRNDLVDYGPTRIRNDFRPQHPIFVGFTSNISNEDGDTIDDQLEATSQRVADKVREFVSNEIDGVELIEPLSSEELTQSLVDGARDVDLIWAFTHGDAHGLSVNEGERSGSKNFLSQNNLILTRSSLSDLSSYDRFSVSDLKSLRWKLLRKIHRPEWPRAPIVALLACESGAPGVFSYAGDEGFVSAFLDRGASAVISTEAEIDEQSALEFSHYFLASLRNGKDDITTGPSNAVWYARAAMYKNGFDNMFGLMISYTGVHGGVISN